ncbi:PorV/PorQ family protein [Elusimicrobiota bacterium]
MRDRGDRATSRDGGGRSRTWIASLSLLLCVWPFATSNGAPTSAAFLKIPTDARAMGLGNGHLALASGVGALGHNPAGAAVLNSKEAAFVYAPHLGGTALGAMAYAHPTNIGSFGLNFLTLRSGEMDGRDASGARTAGFTAEDRAVGISYARGFVRNQDRADETVRLGVSLKHISSRIADYEASSYAVDLGGQLPFRAGRVPMDFGLALRNLGPGMRYLERQDPLPLSAGVGLSAQLFGTLRLAGGMERYVHEERTDLSIGMEVAPTSGFMLRGNYGMSRNAEGGGSTPNLAGGFGVRFGSMQLDYAFMPMGDLGSTQRISLTLRFGRFEPSGARPSKRRRPMDSYYWQSRGLGSARRGEHI